MISALDIIEDMQLKCIAKQPNNDKDKILLKLSL
jgi:hypothetical protein